jgi:hypothetical protein
MITKFSFATCAFICFASFVKGNESIKKTILNEFMETII